MPDERFADHLSHPRGRGHEPAGAFHGAAGGAACGDLVRLSVAVDGERVVDAGFEAAALLRELSAGKVVVLGILGDGSDDAAVRAGLREVPSHGGRVVVRSASVERIGRYAAITNGLKVVGTPTVLVLGKGPKARTLSGLTTTAELDQAVADMQARAAS